MYTSMFIPELKIRRKIWVYLPNQYPVSVKHFPVLYMHDGQNLFDVKSSFAGEWGIDEYLDSTDFAGIVIGIDNGGDARIHEYNPNDTTVPGDGLGDEYLLFLVTVLKPFIDRNFRTLPDAANTAIAGSSMGGLISFYAGLLHPQVFGCIGVFSPSFWLVPYLQEQVSKLAGERHHNQHYYFYGGGLEGGQMLELLEAVSGRLRQTANCEVTLAVQVGGQHTESSWRKMFPDFYSWLIKINREASAT
jgi:predicted alpha/beta superfamily hydrolase